MTQVAEDQLIGNRSDQSLLKDQVAQVVRVAGAAPGQDRLEVDAPLDVGPAFTPGSHQERTQGRSLARHQSHCSFNRSKITLKNNLKKVFDSQC